MAGFPGDDSQSRSGTSRVGNRQSGREQSAGLCCMSETTIWQGVSHCPKLKQPRRLGEKAFWCEHLEVQDVSSRDPGPLLRAVSLTGNQFPSAATGVNQAPNRIHRTTSNESWRSVQCCKNQTLSMK